MKRVLILVVALMIPLVACAGGSSDPGSPDESVVVPEPGNLEEAPDNRSKDATEYIDLTFEEAQILAERQGVELVVLESTESGAAAIKTDKVENRVQISLDSDNKVTLAFPG